MIRHTSGKLWLKDFVSRASQGHTLVKEDDSKTLTIGYRDTFDGELVQISFFPIKEMPKGAVTRWLSTNFSLKTWHSQNMNNSILHTLSKIEPNRDDPLAPAPLIDVNDFLQRIRAHTLKYEPSLTEAFYWIENFDLKVGVVLVHKDNVGALPEHQSGLLWGAHVIVNDLIPVDTVYVLSERFPVLKKLTDYDVSAVTFKPMDHI